MTDFIPKNLMNGGLGARRDFFSSFNSKRTLIVALCLGLLSIPLMARRMADREVHALYTSVMPILADLNGYLGNKSAYNAFVRCQGSTFQLPGSKSTTPLTEFQAELTPPEGAPAPPESAKQKFREAEALTLPCGNRKRGACCPHTVFMRPGTTDINVYYQIFVEHQLRYLYTLFAAEPPKYVLDAGANAGYAASLFKLLWPDAIVVSLEPDPKNYETLVKNTAGFKGVHAVNAGLWGHKARIGRVASHGEWGHVFKEVTNGEGGLQAYGVKDLLRKFKLPRFDFIKIDIEGAEGMVMAPEEDLSWIEGARVVSLEVHDFFASYFGLGGSDISGRVEAAFKGRPFGKASDNEHVLYINYDLLKTLKP